MSGPPSSGRSAQATAQPLPAPLEHSLRLFRALDAAGIAHCHFKSNQHLDAALAGLTDLDMLVDQRQGRAVQSVLADLGYKRFTSLLAAAYPAVEDYLGFDPATGRLVHLHLHYELVAGEPYLKSYRLRLADAILATRIADPATGIQVTHPDHEMLLLLVRCALKLRWRDRLLEHLGRSFIRGGLLREYLWLSERIDPDRVGEAAMAAFGPAAAEATRPLLEVAPTASRLRRLQRTVRGALADQRSCGRIVALALRLTRESASLLSAVNRRWLRLPIPLRRRSPIGGLVVALLGPDGCGKSTLTRELRGWLGWKLDVYPVYFGSGTGPVSLLRWPLKIARGLHARLSSRSATGIASAGGGARRLRWLWAISLAVEKRGRMRSVTRARHRGMMVVCDRYPQMQVVGFNDGPLMASWLDAPGFWRRSIARWEYRVYGEICRQVPDLAIKLNVSPDVAARRKPEVTPAEVRRRLRALEQIDYGDRCRHITLDADQPFEEVVRQARRAIWEQM